MSETRSQLTGQDAQAWVNWSSWFKYQVTDSNRLRTHKGCDPQQVQKAGSDRAPPLSSRKRSKQTAWREARLADWTGDQVRALAQWEMDHYARTPPELPSLTNMSSSLRPARCSTAQGVQHCACDPGYVIQSGGLCQDIDECGLYQGKAGSKLCVHECVNTAGAYHCVCPRGYLLESQPNTCKDVDECVSKEAACPGGEQCVNLYGGFTCVRPECPKPKMNATYVKVSSHQCERTPCPVGSSGCLDAPHSVSFHYIPLQSQLPVPRVLFTMTAPRSQADSQRFTLTRGKGHRGLEVRQAGRHRGELLLTKPLSGPAEVQVDVEMAETSAQGPLGRHVFTVTLLVSQFTF
ncbi:fibulin-7-like isoform X2 [Phyllobates terribilis]|uniref:fibulin-7-like isoform X2 n=1 Tax=Phyllobates terribilis TaxID=111132 RepID=UPI003CCA8888